MATTVRHLLVATDFGETSRAAEDLALCLAKAHGATCLLLHVIEEIDGSAEDDDEKVQAFYAPLQERAQRLLALRATRFADAGVACTVETLIGRRWRAIVRRADEAGVDLIVVGSRRPVAEDGAPVLGTTSQQVFFAATRPLLIARS